MANLSDLVGFALTVTIRYKKETCNNITGNFSAFTFQNEIKIKAGFRFVFRVQPLAQPPTQTLFGLVTQSS